MFFSVIDRQTARSGFVARSSFHLGKSVFGFLVLVRFYIGGWSWTFKAGPLEVELEKVAERLEETRKLASGADAKADLAVERLGEKEEEESEGSVLLAGTPSANQIVQSQVMVTPNQRQVLRALNDNKFVARTLTGIAKEVAISIRTTQIHLANLVEKGLVAKAHASDGRTLWVLTPTDRAIANEA